jgi:hypothetical protein
MHYEGIEHKTKQQQKEQHQKQRRGTTKEKLSDWESNPDLPRSDGAGCAL